MVNIVYMLLTPTPYHTPYLHEIIEGPISRLDKSFCQVPLKCKGLDVLNASTENNQYRYKCAVQDNL